MPYISRQDPLMTKLSIGRLEQVLSTAMAEKKLAVSQSSLPHQFYDSQHSSLDIDEALRLCAERPDLAPEDQMTGLRSGFSANESFTGSGDRRKTVPNDEGQ
jgi:hypothetical protein